MTENKVMRVTVESPIKPKEYVPTAEELKREYDYTVAVQLLDLLRDSGLISDDEFNKSEAKFRKRFSPHLAPLMPENPC